ncbi:hypothetical protein BZA77DRAFT_296582 [Pyronema omphalodes]|nr:hypothetical protein BZA77DRAFT_296582 [Pyronema omphalodes]
MHLPTPPTMLLLLLLSVSTTASSLNIKPNSLTLPVPVPHQPQAIILSPPTFTHQHQLHEHQQPQHDQQYHDHQLHEQKSMNISTSASTPSTRRRTVVAEEDTITARKIVGGIAVAVLVAVI